MSKKWKPTEDERDFGFYDDEEIDERRRRKERDVSLKRQRERKVNVPDIDEE